MLQAQHQLYQLRLRKPLEFLSIHRQDESHTSPLGKGVGSYPTMTAPIKELLDRPINSLSEDRLDRDSFIENIVHCLIEEHFDGHGRHKASISTGFVVGLTGEWGSGKSSILKMLKSRLNKSNDVITVYFNPWIFSNNDDLFKAFFKALSDGVGRSPIEQLRKIKESLEKYEKAINLTAQAVHWGWTAVSGTALFAAVASVISIKMAGYGYGLGAGFAIPTAAAAAGWVKILTDSIPKANKLSLEDEKNRLEKRILESKFAIVVLIDELDRLEDAEVKTVAQLIKAVGDINGISYLVAYDTSRVTFALGQGADDFAKRTSGSQYLEKIIQLPIPIRPLFEDDLDRLLLSELSKIDIFPQSLSNQMKDIFDQLKHEIRTPRDVRRLIGTYSALARATLNEIESIDVLAYCWILIKNPLLRNDIAVKYDDLVIDPSQEVLLQRAVKANSKDASSTPEAVLGPHAIHHTRLLQLTFPVFGARTTDYEPGTRIFRRRNLVRLLYLGNPPGAFTKSDVESIWNLDDVEVVRTRLITLITEGQISQFLDRLDDLLHSLPETGDNIFWPALSKALQRENDWIGDAGPQYANVEDAAETLMRLGLRKPELKYRVKSVISNLISIEDIGITSWIVRRHLFVYGPSVHPIRLGSDTIYDKIEFSDLLRNETERYKQMILNGEFLKKAPNAEPLYAVMNQPEVWTADLRTGFTLQLASYEAISSLAALIVPPGYSTDRETLNKMFIVDIVGSKLSQVMWEGETRPGWLRNSVKRLSIIMSGADPYSPS
jgi:Cdc6-like AAA superfamily ATPase